MHKTIACLRTRTGNSTGDMPGDKAAARPLWGLRPDTVAAKPAIRRRSLWTADLQKRQPPVALPFTTPDQRRTDLPAMSVDFELPEALSNRIRAFARSETTQVFSVMLAAWQALLFRHTSCGCFTVGCAAPGGRSSVPERPLLVPAAMDRTVSFRDTVRAVADNHAAASASLFTLEEATTHEAVSGKTHPACQTAFIQRHCLGERLSRVVSTSNRTPCELACVWEDASPAIRGRIEYPAGVLTPDAASCLAGRLVNLLRTALVMPNAPVSALPIQTLAEYRAASA